ncbi:hypothetical protein ACFLQ0_01840 [Nitrospinota bacterium]
MPGEESYVETTFTMNRAMGGPHHFLIVLETNDPRNPKIELHIKADFTAI